MELKSNMRAVTYFKKMITGDTKGILPFPVTVQKPVPQQKPCTPLPRCTPQQAGVPAKALDIFLRSLAQTEHLNAHTAMVVRHGQVVCEGNFAPYHNRYWHITHSLCKSITGTAIGMLVDEGKLSLDEFVCDIFPDKCTLLTGKRTRSITVHHLVTMRSGVNYREMGCVLDKDWVSAFLSSDLMFDPGSEFQYNSMNSYMLSAIVTRKTGLTLLEYLTPRLFEPLGFGSVAWETCPLGNSKGGWGMYILPEDLAKVGLLYLQKGVWNGKQLLSAAWIDAATQPDSKHENGEEYGYQLWTHSEDSSFLFNGMFGQYVVMLPSLDMVIVINAGSANLFTHGPTYSAIAQLGAAINAAEGAPLPNQSADNAALAFTLSHLQYAHPVPPLPVQNLWQRIQSFWLRPVNTALPALCEELSGKTFVFPKNRISFLPVVTSTMCDYYTKGTASVGFALENGKFYLLWTEGNAVQKLEIGFEKAAMGEVNMGGNVFVVGVLGKFVRNEDDHDVLKLIVNFPECTSTQRLKFFFLPTGLRLHWDEMPSLPFVLDLLQKTNPEFLKMNTAFIKDVEYLQYLIDQFCMPTLTELPKPKDPVA